MNRSHLQHLALAALFAALTAVCSQIQIPLPYIPINLALFAVHLSGLLLGSKWAGLAQLVYLLLGLIGLPVFSGFGSGPAILFGRTGGYIIGYVLCALIDGHAYKKDLSYPMLFLHLILGTLVCYTFGTIWFMFLTKMSLALSLSYCVLPFLPGDAIKIALALVLARRLQKPLTAMGL